WDGASRFPGEPARRSRARDVEEWNAQERRVGRAVGCDTPGDRGRGDEKVIALESHVLIVVQPGADGEAGAGAPSGINISSTQDDGRVWIDQTADRDAAGVGAAAGNQGGRHARHQWHRLRAAVEPPHQVFTRNPKAAGSRRTGRCAWIAKSLARIRQDARSGGERGSEPAVLG